MVFSLAQRLSRRLACLCRGWSRPCPGQQELLGPDSGARKDLIAAYDALKQPEQAARFRTELAAAEAASKK